MPTDRLGRLQAELGRKTWVTHQVDAHSVYNCVRHDPCHGDFECNTWHAFMGHGRATLVRGRAGGKGLSIGKRQGHAGIFVGRMPDGIPDEHDDVINGSTPPQHTGQGLGRRRANPHWGWTRPAGRGVGGSAGETWGACLRMLYARVDRRSNFLRDPRQSVIYSPTAAIERYSQAYILMSHAVRQHMQPMTGLPLD
jgi:hypothetical protein